MMATIKLEGRVFITFDIEAVTGLHIGGTESGIEIGGVDKTVIRDKLTNRPYIPGSSLRGKMRSLLEKYHGLEQNQPIGQGRIHSCGAGERNDEESQKRARNAYLNCDVCQVFGVPGERKFATPTRLVVRDVHLSDASAARLENSGTDLPYTEVKTEVSIDRVTSAANPRQMERVPAGSVFSNAELVYSIYNGDDCDAGKDVARLQTVIEGLHLLEDDYLGGLGSRGSGKVRLQHIKVKVRAHGDLGEPQTIKEYPALDKLGQDVEGLLHTVKQTLNL
ncbi:MAG: type III-A CRISPR-associated RAMP protein Csm3 [Anaerolineae bacterium]|nr:type III-A CRISPR-associated RAMP protein Csm3 [Anaerolineae bacterium]